MSAKWSVQPFKGSVADADVLLIIDTEVGPVENKQVLFSTLALAAQTPWRGDIDAATFNLDNLTSVDLNNTLGTNPIIFALQSASESTVVFGSNFQLTSGFIDMAEIATPTDPATDVGRLYVDDDGGITTLFFKDNGGTVTNLLAGGGAGIDEILDSAIMPAVETNTLSLSWTNIPFDGTVDYIEVIINFKQSIIGEHIDIDINNTVGDEIWDWSYINNDGEDGIVAENSTFNDFLESDSRTDNNKVTYIRLRIYMGAFMDAKSSGGPTGEWYEGGIENQNNTVYTRNGTWLMNDATVHAVGVSSVEIVLTGLAVFRENSTAVAYKRITGITP